MACGRSFRAVVLALTCMLLCASTTLCACNRRPPAGAAAPPSGGGHAGGPLPGPASPPGSGGTQPTGPADTPPPAFPEPRAAIPLTLEGEISLPPTAFRPLPSPRGDLLVYYLLATGDVACLADSQGRDRVRLPGNGHWGPVSWSSDGTRLCYYTSSTAPSAEPEARRVVIYNVDEGSTNELPLPRPTAGGVEALPRFLDGERLVQVYTADGVYSAPAGAPSLTRVETAPGVGLKEGPFAVSRDGLMACAAAAGGVEVWTERSLKKSIAVPGEVADIAFTPWGAKIAILCRDPEGYSLYLYQFYDNPGTRLVDRGQGEATGLCWSPEGRFLAYRVTPAGGTLARFLDTAGGAVGSFPSRGCSGVAWLDPFTAIALFPEDARTRGCLVAVGDPPRVTRIQLTEWRSRASGGREDTPELEVANNCRVAVARDGFLLNLRYDRLVRPETAAALVSCRPGPQPSVRGTTYEGFSAVELVFDKGIPVGQEVRLQVAPVRGGEAVDLTIARLPEPAVTLRSLDRPELETRVVHRFTNENLSYTLGVGTKRFHLEFSRPMDRASVEAALRQNLAAASRIDFEWAGDSALDLSVTTDHAVDGLKVDATEGLSRDGVAVWMQPSFPYGTWGPYRLMEARPDGTDSRQFGALEGALDSWLLSPDGARLAYGEDVDYGDDFAITVHWVRPVAGGPPVRLPAPPVAWFPDSRRLLCGFKVVGAATGQVVGALPGEEPREYWRGSMSPSGRRLAVFRVSDWGKRRLSLDLYDLQAWTKRDLGDVAGLRVSDGFPYVMPAAWSPDEQSIAFMETDPERRTSLAILDLATMQRTSLPDAASPQEGPRRAAHWSPDGRHILQLGATGWSVITPAGDRVHALESGLNMKDPL